MTHNIITKSAALCVILSDKGRILMVSRPENPSQFGIPGGKVEIGEAPAAAAIREVYEEAGIRLNSDELFFLMQKTVPSRREPNVEYKTYCYVANSAIRELDYKSTEQLILKWVEPWQIVQPPYAYFNTAVYKELCDRKLVKKD